MAKAKSTTGMGKEHEEFVTEMFEWDNARRSRSSGASAHDPVDVTTDSMVIECEATEAKSYSLKLSFWEEVKQKQHSGKQPGLAIRFRDPANGKHTDLLISNLHDATADREELETLRTMAIKPEGK
jgi:hypothetical protein